MKKQISIAITAALITAVLCASQEQSTEQERSQPVTRTLLERMSDGQQIPNDLVRLINQFTPHLQKTGLAGHSNQIREIHFSPDNNRIVSWNDGYGDCVKVWNTWTGDCLTTMRSSRTPKNIVFSTDSRLTTTSSGGSSNFDYCSAFELDTGHYVGTGCGRSNKALALSPDNKMLAYQHTQSNDVYLRPIAAPWGSDTTIPCTEYIHTGTFVDNDTLTVYTCNNTLQFWSTSTATLKKSIDTQNHVIFSPDKSFFVTASDNHNHPIQLYNTQTYQLSTLENSVNSYCSLNLNQNGTQLLTLSPDYETPGLTFLSRNYYIQVWDIESGTCLRKIPLREFEKVNSAHFTYDDNMIALTFPGRFCLLDIETKEYIKQTDIFTQACICPTINPDGTIVAAVDHKNKQCIRLFDLFQCRQILDDKRKKREHAA